MEIVDWVYLHLRFTWHVNCGLASRFVHISGKSGTGFMIYSHLWLTLPSIKGFFFFLFFKITCEARRARAREIRLIMNESERVRGIELILSEKRKREWEVRLIVSEERLRERDKSDCEERERERLWVRKGNKWEWMWESERERLVVSCEWRKETSENESEERKRVRVIRREWGKIARRARVTEHGSVAVMAGLIETC